MGTWIMVMVRGFSFPLLLFYSMFHFYYSFHWMPQSELHSPSFPLDLSAWHLANRIDLVIGTDCATNRVSSRKEGDSLQAVELWSMGQAHAHLLFYLQSFEIGGGVIYCVPVHHRAFFRDLVSIHYDLSDEHSLVFHLFYLGDFLEIVYAFCPIRGDS